MFKTQQRQRAGWHWVLALVLLLMQQAGLRHGLQHATRDDGAPTHAACLECVAHHASDAGTLDATTPTLFTPALLGHVLTAMLAPASIVAGVCTGYLSRAPPVSSI